MPNLEAAQIRRAWLLRAWLTASLWAWVSTALGAAIAVACGYITVHNLPKGSALIVLGGGASAGLLALGLTSAIACRWRRLINALESFARTGRAQVAIGRFNDMRPLALALANASERRARVYAAALQQDALRRHLTADLVHDIATPISCFGAMLDRLQGHAPELFTTLDPLQCHIESTLHDLSRLTRSLQPQLTLRPAWTDLSGLMEDLCGALARTRAPGRIVLQTQPLSARVDPHRIRSAALALIDNALRHGDGGPVFVEVRACEDSAVLTVRNTLSAKGHAEAPAAPYSAGLGVPWARAIAEAHQGRLSLVQVDDGIVRASLGVPIEGSEVRSVRGPAREYEPA